MPYFPPLLPAVDSRTIIHGSVDSTKLLRFEVDGFTTGTTRVLTPPNADATIAGLEVAQTFTQAQTINVNSLTALTVENSGNAAFLFNTTNSRLGIGGRTPSYAVDAIDSNGALRVTSTSSDNTNKSGRFVVPNYTNADGDTAVFGIINLQASNQLSFGGGLSSFNTATHLFFYAAANTTTKTGTQIARITTSGLRVDPTGVAANASAPLHVAQSSTTAATPAAILNQSDIDQPIIEFVTTIGTGNAIEAVGSKTLTTTHFLMVKIPGSLTRYIPMGTIA